MKKSEQSSQFAIPSVPVFTSGPSTASAVVASSPKSKATPASATATGTGTVNAVIAAGDQPQTAQTTTSVPRAKSGDIGQSVTSSTSTPSDPTPPPQPQYVIPPNLPSSSYDPPSWAGIPDYDFKLEIIRAGVELEPIDLTTKLKLKRYALEVVAKELGTEQVDKNPYTRLSSSTYLLMGRLPHCDIVLEHPSISREHCLLQFRETTGQVYMYDLGSGHGTFINKKRIPAKEYVELMVGDTFVLGASSRMHVLTGPDFLRPTPPEVQSATTPNQKFQAALRAKFQKALLKEVVRDRILEHQAEQLAMRQSLHVDNVFARMAEVESELESEQQRQSKRAMTLEIQESLKSIPEDQRRRFVNWINDQSRFENDAASIDMEGLDLEAVDVSKLDTSASSTALLVRLYQRLSQAVEDQKEGQASTVSSLQAKLNELELTLYTLWHENFDSYSDRKRDRVLQTNSNSDRALMKRIRMGDGEVGTLGRRKQGEGDGEDEDDSIDPAEKLRRKEIKRLLEEMDDDASEDELYDRAGKQTPVRLHQQATQSGSASVTLLDEPRIETDLFNVSSNSSSSVEAAILDQRVCLQVLRQLQRQLDELLRLQTTKIEEEEDSLSAYMNKVNKAAIGSQQKELERKIQTLTEILKQIEERVKNRTKQHLVAKYNETGDQSYLKQAAVVTLDTATALLPIHSKVDPAALHKIPPQAETTSTQSPSRSSGSHSPTAPTSASSSATETATRSSHAVNQAQSRARISEDSRSTMSTASTLARLQQREKDMQQSATKAVTTPKLSEAGAFDKIKKIYEEKFSSAGSKGSVAGSQFDPNVAGVQVVDSPSSADKTVVPAGRPAPTTVANRADTAGLEDTADDAIVWVRPKNQTGDGKSHLNAKYGY